MLSSFAGLTRGKRWALGAFVLATLLSIGWFGVRTPKSTLPPPPPPWMGPIPVHVVTATKADLKVHLNAIGSVTPLNTVTLRSQVNGQLLRILFDEGGQVSEGDLLAEIDPASYKVRLAQAEGTLQQTRAQVKNAEANLRLYQRLIKQKSIAQQQYDQQQALVEQLRGTLKTHQAQVDDARLQLSYTQITAPISGRTGLRLMDAGNLVSSGASNGLVTITQTQPIAVTFSIPENQLVAVRRAYQKAKTPLLVEAWDSSAQQLLARGELTTLDNQIDASTGSLKLKAQFANRDDQLFPNQFINVRLQLLTLKDVVTIPGDAVQYGAKGTYVYLAEEGKAKMRKVSLGVLEGERAQIKAGLQGGESVILEGLDRLWEGKEVKVMGPVQTTPPARTGQQGAKDTAPNANSTAKPANAERK